MSYAPSTRVAEVTSRTQDTLGLLNRLHDPTGVTHDYWAMNVWGWLLFAASVSLLVLGVTGIVMWFTRHAQRVSGAIVLGAGLAWGITLLILAWRS